MKKTIMRNGCWLCKQLMRGCWGRSQFLILYIFAICAWPRGVIAEIITIDPHQPPPPLLSSPELEKLATLQHTKDLFLFSGVSPDDQVMVLGVLALGSGNGGEPAPPEVAFLNIKDSSLQPIDPLFLMLSPQTDIVWRDAQTALYVASNEAGEPVLVTLKRPSGAVESAPLALPGQPISLAPNGTRLLFEMPSAQGVTLAAANLTSGEVEPLVDYPTGGTPSQIAWSADGAKVALVRVTLPPDLVADPDQIMELATRDVLGEASPAQNPFWQGNVVDLFDLERNEYHPAALTASDGDGYLFRQISWSPDGETLLAKMVRPSRPAGRQHPITFFPDRAYFRLYDADLVLVGKVDRPEIEAAQTSHAFFVSPDELVFAAPVGATFRLFSYQRSTDRFRELPVEEGTFAEAPQGYQIRATHHSRQLIFNHSSFQQPPEIYRFDLDAGEPQALTTFNAPAAEANQIRADEVTVTLRDSTTRTGYLLQPAGAPFPPQNVPIVLYQQGGPGGAMTNRWGATADEPFNLLPNFGIAVLFMPFSGREGSGPAFFNALIERQQFGARDIDEAAQAVQSLIAQGYTSRGQVGITGCSYGGYFTSQSIVRHPQLYAAANAQCSPLDLVQWWQSVGRLLVTYVEGSLPDEGRREYRRDSPLHRAVRVRTPLLLFHGVADFLPLEVAQTFHDRIEATTTPVNLLVFEEEGHNLALSASRSIAAQHQIAWFRKYLAKIRLST